MTSDDKHKNSNPDVLAEDERPPAVEENGSHSELDRDQATSGEIADGSSDDGETGGVPGDDDKNELDGGRDTAEAVTLDAVDLANPSDSAEVPVDADHGDLPERLATPDEGDTGTQGRDLTAGPMLAELVATRAELRRVETERNDLLERLARRQADFENYRKRVERERGETYQRLVGDVVSKLLPVMDNMRRALKAENMMEKNESAEFRHFLRGVELIYKQLNDALKELGVEAVPAVGEPFDPHVHEAVATEHSEEYEADTVTQELLRGYRLGEKLLRPAMVKVSTKQ